MKKLALLLLPVLFIWACNSGTSTHDHDHGATADESHDHDAHEEGSEAKYPADSLSADGLFSFHGLRIDANNALPVAQLSGMMEGKSEVQNLKLTGEVLECCQAKGCWMTMELPDGQEMRVTFRDYGFFVPKDAAGKVAVMEGKAYMDTVSVDMLRHYAMDGGMSEEEANAKYTEPEVSLSFEAFGVILKNSGEEDGEG
jgi:hypothetical protein